MDETELHQLQARNVEDRHLLTRRLSDISTSGNTDVETETQDPSSSQSRRTETRSIASQSIHPRSSRNSAISIEPSEDSKPNRTPSSSHQTWFSDWRNELIASFLALASILALVGTLMHITDEPLPGWSLNSIISFYSVLFKGCLMFVMASVVGQRQWTWFGKERKLHDITRFDEAREVLGSLRWLLWRPWGDVATTLGALVVIAAVFTDPFIQQLIDYEDCSADMVEIATIPRTSYFNPDMLSSGHDLVMTPLPDEITAYNSGLFSQPPRVSLSCSTGNCTYATSYASVGYCTRCRDISDTVTVDCSNTSVPIFSLPSGLRVDQQNGFEGDEQVFSAGFNAENNEYDFLSGSSACGETVIDRNVDLNKPMPGCDDSAATGYLWKCRGYGAASCAVGPCMKVFNASVEAGILTETVLEETEPFEFWEDENENTRAVIDTSCITGDEMEELSREGYTIDLERKWLQYNMSISAPSNFSEWLLNSSAPLAMTERGCMYFMKSKFITGFRSFYLNPLFRGEVYGLNGRTRAFYTYNNSQTLQHLYNFGYNDFTWLDSILQNASTAMTNHIRQNGDPRFSKHAEGVMHHFAICIGVNWVWITLPALLYVMVVLLLAWSIWASRHYSVPVWKSSPLAYLFHGRLRDLGKSTAEGNASLRDGTPALASLAGMEALSRGIVVKLENKDDSFALVRTGSALLAGGSRFGRLRRFRSEEP